MGSVAQRVLEALALCRALPESRWGRLLREWITSLTWAWFNKKGSGTVAGTARRVLRTTVPDPFLLNQALK
jgi:hypothetical protein